MNLYLFKSCFKNIPYIYFQPHSLRISKFLIHIIHWEHANCFALSHAYFQISHITTQLHPNFIDEWNIIWSVYILEFMTFTQHNFAFSLYLINAFNSSKVPLQFLFPMDILDSEMLLLEIPSYFAHIYWINLTLLLFLSSSVSKFGFL